MPYRAVIVGASGAVGGALVKELIAAPECEEVVTVTRRPLEGIGSPKLRATVIDLARLEAGTAEAAVGCDRAFCTIGVGQPRKTTYQDFWRVDVEYSGAFAKGAAAAGVQHISLLSSVGSDANSRNPYMRVKGAAEQAVQRAGIARTSFFRPSLLVTDYTRYGLQDRITQSLFPLLSVLLPARFRQIHVNDLAKAMRLNAERAPKGAVEILHYPEFVTLLEGRRRR